jgi:hypothetical protein
MNTCPKCGGQLKFCPLENDLTRIEGEMICEACAIRLRWEYQFSFKALAIIALTPIAVGYAFLLGRPEGENLSIWYWIGLIVLTAIALRATRLSMRRLVIEESPACRDS